MSSRANLIQAKSLYTFSNELNLPEGALVIAKNVNIDEPSVITPRRGYNDYADALPTGNDRVSQLMQYKNKLIRHYDDVLQWEANSSLFTSFSGTYKQVEDGLRIKYQESNGNLYFTTLEGIKKISATNTTDFSTLNITDAGGIKAVDLTAKVLPTVGGFLPAQSKTAYRIVFGIKDINNNIILGEPSSRYVLTNTSADIKIPEKSKITVINYTLISALDPADYILFNTPDVQYAVWLNKSGTQVEPQNSDLLGRQVFEVDAGGVSNNEVAASIASEISKNVPDVEVGLSSNEITITNTVEGDVDDVYTNNVAAFTVASTIDGSVTLGTTANAQITFTLPSGITNSHFYQVYRTAAITVVDGITTLSDLDPGEEFNLVFESGITTANIVAEEISTEDITSQTFRLSGLPLYTNPITGQGILQANSRPPIAKDVALFRNSMFYANTKSNHRVEISLLSVDDITSGVTELIIGNQDGIYRYSFIGTPESTVITADTFANTTNGGYILVNSANDERKYVLLLDKGAAVDPSILNTMTIRVDISLAVTAQDVKNSIEIALSDILDFIYSDLGGNNFKITNANNGNSTDTTISGLGGAWALGAIVQGTGEDTLNNEVLLSGLTSTSQAIDETARSIVRVINKDSNSPIIATYLSAEGDLPGQMLFENKSLEDNPFYISTNDTNFQQEMNPELPILETITTITPSGSNTIIGAAGHGLFVGDIVYITSPMSFPTIGAKYTIQSTNLNDFTIALELQTGDATDSFYWIASVESDNVESKNRVYFSKINLPEAVPIVNYVDIGPQDEEIERIVALRDNLIVFKTDGIYLLTGSSALTGFSVRLLDGSSRLAAPDSPAVLDNQIFCLTNEGVSTVTETGVGVISRYIENKIFDIINSRFDYRNKVFGVGYISDKAYLLFMPEKIADTYSTQCYRYNTYERSWTRWDVSANCGVIKRIDDKMYLGAGDREYVLQERKNGNRTDHCDRSFILQIPDLAVNNNIVRLSNVSNLKVGDVILQVQYVTISQYNRLLRTLDIDAGLDDLDYESSLKAMAGDNMATKLAALNSKLVADDASGTVTVHTFLNSDWADMQEKFNDFISELNNPLCDTIFKNYDESEDTTPYEAIITNVNSIKNNVTLTYTLPLLEGNVEAFKSFDSVIQWSPQHFGDPSALKQVREGTVMFDQNNFYSAKLEYSSDLAASFVGSEFKGKGTGYWGYGVWGDHNLYWGGDGNDIPYRTIIPRDKQRCRYLNVKFTHQNARESWRIVGISAVVKPISSRGYR